MLLTPGAPTSAHIDRLFAAPTLRSRPFLRSHISTVLCAAAVTLLLSLVVQPAPAAAQTLDHFTCYRTGTVKRTPKFQRVSPVGLVDRFRQSDVEVKKPKFICTPTSKNGEDPTAPTHEQHLLDYDIRPATKFTKQTGILIADQFGTLSLDVNKPLGLKVPTAKSLTAPPAEPSSPLIDHFQCYGVKVSSDTPSFASQSVTIQDQFGAFTATLKRPRRLCVPVNKRNESPGAENHPDDLLCYSLRQTSEPRFTKVTPLFVNNQFGPLTIDARRPRELCVPAVRPPAPTPTVTVVPPTPIEPTVTPTIVFPTATPTVIFPTATPTIVLPTITLPLPTSTPEQPTATPEQPTATAEQPTATAEQPTATAEQPTATPEQPTATPEQPTATPTIPLPLP